VGSSTGLRHLADLLRECAFDDRFWDPPTHRHLGPYEYLTVTASETPIIDERGIAGSAQDLDVLACYLEAALEVFGPGESVDLSHEYAGAGNWGMRLDVQEDGFDPATADPLLVHRNGAE
jgi:hypothetical protein